MSSNSLETLLAWMKETSRMLGWGMIVALERRKSNLLMSQEYIRRFDAGSYLPPIRGEVTIVENQWVQVIHDFVMDVPLLSFENADLNDSKAMLSMSVVGGSQLTLKKESAGWTAVMVDEIDSLQGPKLYLDLLLNQVPGNVDVDGRIILDLSRSDNFRLTFAQSPTEQRLGGDFFKDLFNGLAPDKRIWPLGRIERGTNDLMHPQSFGLRTQASGAAARDPQSSEHGNGAILAFVRMEGSNEGDYPGANSGFRYLIPDDAGKDYSATVLFDSRRMLMSLLAESIGEMIGNRNFEYTYSDRELVSAIALGGRIVIPQLYYYETLADPEYPGGIECGMGHHGLEILAANVLIIEKSEDGVVLRWEYSGESTMAGYVRTNPPQNVTYSMGYEVSMMATYKVVVEFGDFVLKRMSCDVVADISLPDLLAVPLEAKGLPVDYWAYLARKLRELVDARDLKALIESTLEETVPVNLSLTALVENTVRLNFGQAIQHLDIALPYDIGLFGRVNPTQTSFVISPMRPLMSQGETQQFSTEPVIHGVQWTVENLPEDSGSPGTISAGGLYQAPAAASIEGRFKRVRVTATDPSSDYHSSALVTVLLDELSVHPLIQICDVGTRVELAAGALKEGELIWSIKNPVANESGEVRPSDESEGDHTYHHGPVVPNKTYVLDEIEVKNNRTNKTRSVHVLALQKGPGAPVGILHSDIGLGQVQLETRVNGNPMAAEWSLPLGGPGSIDSTGLYRVAPTATERFVLIFALVDGGGFGKFEGHLILPLPLVEFPQLLEALSQ
ncbi:MULTISPECIES: hypothetical protein [unclassified Pseudomonas]|uniref:hypothetical protein n=1 Tax=unclassified Pseudomonas TaxID=196821 RepID=UPI00215E105C|nr:MULTISPECIES: hypothetical protein [unclassified Pseudomonas]UVM60035.1 hypothetical protein LOY50_21180 [Pseudomonas sp. B21-010]WPN62129.1 hypothetical protein QMK48_20840 [Pseudomonas sp. P9_32]WPN67883.1 hypothetical protein QMK47_21735 [Pseudomonas sp. P9_35]